MPVGTDRAGLAELATAHRHLLSDDEEVAKEPEKYFKRVIEIVNSFIADRAGTEAAS